MLPIHYDYIFPMSLTVYEVIEGNLHLGYFLIHRWLDHIWNFTFHSFLITISLDIPLNGLKFLGYLDCARIEDRLA